MKTVCLVSGGFDPLHSGHIQYLKSAAALAAQNNAELWVLLNTDSWLERKKGKAFMQFAERQAVLENIKGVDRVLSAIDTDDTVKESLAALVLLFRTDTKFVFLKDGDRNSVETIPESEVAEKLGVQIVLLGNPKVQSSSAIVAAAQPTPLANERVKRDWGHYEVLEEGEGYKLKKLYVKKGGKITLQRHKYRSEQWTILSGWGDLSTGLDTSKLDTKTMTGGNTELIPMSTWHTFNAVEETVILELQQGSACDEEDIERA